MPKDKNAYKEILHMYIVNIEGFCVRHVTTCLKIVIPMHSTVPEDVQLYIQSRTMVHIL